MNIAAKLPNRRKIAGSVIYHVLVAGSRSRLGKDVFLDARPGFIPI